MFNVVSAFECVMCYVVGGSNVTSVVFIFIFIFFFALHM